MSAAIVCSGLTKRFGVVSAALDVDLRVESGTIHALLGPSGCGKTTVLRLISGFETPDAGTVAIEERSVAGDGAWVPPEHRAVGMVFQDYALFPHLDVRRNVAFGLTDRTPTERARRVDELLELTGLGALGDRMPEELSGGERQRTALARALAPGSRVLLLDEPFSNLDARLRGEMRDELRRIVRAVGATALLVTHDRQEAFGMADSVSVMLAGRLVQTGTPEEVYHTPCDEEVGVFVGPANCLDGTADGARATCVLGDVPLRTPLNGPVRMIVRPEQIRLTRPDDRRGGDAGIPVTVEERTFYGHDVALELSTASGERLTAQVGPDLAAQRGETLRASVGTPVAAWAQPAAA